MLKLSFNHFPTFEELWESCIENYLVSSTDAMIAIFDRYDVVTSLKVIDTCVGGGTFGVELLERGYDLTTADANAGMLELFKKKLAQRGIDHAPMLATWDELSNMIGKKKFDAAICCGNSLIYAGGYWNAVGMIDRVASINGMCAALKTFRSLLVPGGVLFVDKPADDEKPTEDLVAKVIVTDGDRAGEYDVFFSVRFDGDCRTAQILLCDVVTGEEYGTPNMAYSPTSVELETMLREAGFKVAECVATGASAHFPLWVARAV